MAYAKKTDTAEATRRAGEEDITPYYGFPINLPHYFAVDSTSDSLKKKFAMESLERAIANFDESLKLDPNYIPSLLGYAWSQEQLGQKEEAIKGYRLILKRANKDGAVVSRSEANETAKYLIKLLDKEQDKEEIERLKKSIASYKPDYMISPILIPLGEDLSFEELIDTSAEVLFNLDGTGQKRWQWITPKAGWLVYLNNPKETIESGFQLFGNVSFNIFWENGYQALSTLDDNQDNKIGGAKLSNLAIWQDLNSDGVFEKGEAKTMNDLGISSLSFDFEKKNSRLLFNSKGVEFNTGKISASYDWFPRCMDKAL